MREYGGSPLPAEKIPHDPEGWEPVRFEYREIDHCCQNFSLVDGWLDERGLQRRGEVGNAEARLIRSQDIVEVRRHDSGKNETIFLHPRGVDEECDDAWMSLES